MKKKKARKKDATREFLFLQPFRIRTGGGAVLECGNLSIVRMVGSKRDAPPVWLLVADRSVEFGRPSTSKYLKDVHIAVLYTGLSPLYGLFVSRHYSGTSYPTE